MIGCPGDLTFSVLNATNKSIIYSNEALGRKNKTKKSEGNLLKPSSSFNSLTTISPTGKKNSGGSENSLQSALTTNVNMAKTSSGGKKKEFPLLFKISSDGHFLAVAFGNKVYYHDLHTKALAKIYPVNFNSCKRWKDTSLVDTTIYHIQL